MFCPVCKAEYREGFTKCSDCDVDLVKSLDAIPGGLEADDATYELLWSGIDPRIFQEFRAALQAAGIFFQERPPKTAFLYQSLRPPLELWTLRRDHDAVDKMRRQVFGDDDEPPAGLSSEAISEGESAAEQGNSGEEESDVDEPMRYFDSSVPDDIGSEADPEDASAEVWSGEDAQMKEMLLACLRENDIGSVVDDTGGQNRIRVLPASEARAREIIREVVEASPPE